MSERADVRFDWERETRIGLCEAIWGEHKSAEQIAAILQQSADRHQRALVTRVNESKARAVHALLQRQELETPLQWHEHAHGLSYGALPEVRPDLGEVMVL